MSSSVLLSPLTIRKTTLRNRIMLPSMVTHYCAVNGEVSERLIAYHAERAYGGVGLNMLESTSVDDTGKSYWPGVSIASDYFIKGLRRLTDAIHAHGGKAGIQLNHAGRLAQPAVSGHPRQLVSYIPGLTTYDDIHVMDEDDIERVIGSFCSAAERAAEAGFDVIEIHGAHGYLLSQFMSPLFNRREDAYGGNFEKRMRVPVEVIRGIRKRLGPDFPLFFRCSVEEYLPGGITLELARDIARTVADNGIDLFNLSVGLGETNRFTGPPPCLPKGWNADRSAAIKEALGDRALVGVAGRIIDRESADAVLNSGKADLVVMGRALIADPDLPNKLAANRDDAVIPCVGCNEGCVARLRERKAVACAVNPRTGCEGMYPRTPAAVSKHVVIVGGGPAGMQAALVAAERGHRVTLFEKRTRLGGLANIAALPPHKDLYAVLVNRFSERLIASGVKVFLGTAPSVADLAELKPDTLIVATGSVPVIPRFCEGIANAVTAEDILTGKAKAGQRVLVVGGGMVGSETAEYLALKGGDVTILELRPDLAADMQARARSFLLESLREHKVKALTSTELVSVGPDGRVAVKDAYGSQRELPPFDTLVLALGYRPSNALCAELSLAGVPFTAIGDCRRVGKVLDAMHEAYTAAYNL